MALAAASFALTSAVHAAVTVDRLRCEYLENPLGIDASNPRLSWNLATSDPAARGIAQTAYQVLVASSAEKLADDEGDLWDSGRVESDKSIHIPLRRQAARLARSVFLEGPRLGPGRRRLRLERAGPVGRWAFSKPPTGTPSGSASTATTIPSPSPDTNWIWFPEGEADKAVPPGDRYFRRTSTLPADRKIKRARYLATADDQCKAFINGRDIGGRDNFRTVKDSDLTHDMQPGKNLLAVIGMNKSNEPNPAGLVGMLTIEFDRGEPLVILTDDKWKASDKEQPGWNTDPNFDDSQWQAAQVTGPVGMEPWGDVRARKTAASRPAISARSSPAQAKKVRRATVSYSGLGLSELYLNGEKVGDHVLSPGATEYPKRVLYVTHDVTDQIKRGENALGVILGNGRYYSMRSKVYAGMPHYGYPKLLLNLRDRVRRRHDAKKSSATSPGSSPPTARSSPTTNTTAKSTTPARNSPAGAKPASTTPNWQAAELVDVPEGAVAAQMIEPIRVVETIKPVKITEPKPGVFIFDMGQNMVGWCRLKVSGPAGTKVKLRHAETLNPDGTLYLANIRGAKVTDIYTLKGDGTEIWEPRFTYHGFRFVEVTGFPGKPTLDTLEGRSSTTISKSSASSPARTTWSTRSTRTSSGARAATTAASPPTARSATSGRAGSATAPKNRRASRTSSTSRPSTRSGCKTWKTRSATAAASPTSAPPTGRSIPTTSPGRRPR